jgi:thiamine biosynthesis lipoprotein
MSSFSNIELRRCRPLLGTFVEITAGGPEEAALHAAVNAAFVAIERVQSLMSAHDPDSELSRVNREASLGPVKISTETREVLGRADQLARASEGAFDVTIAPTLAQWGFLPPNLRRKNAGDWQDLLLLDGDRVFFLRPMAVDLGGIAKGFAVDQAIETLRELGVVSGVVNAGGDLRVFGGGGSVAHVRRPSRPQSFARTIHLVNSALATSSPCFTERRLRDRSVSHLVNPRTRVAITGARSVTVRASECWMADALTKVVLNAPWLAGDLLSKYRADAIILEE